MASNPNLINTLLRLQPGANRITLPDETEFEQGGFGGDADDALAGFAARETSADPLGALRGGRKAELTERIFNEKRAPNRAMPGNLDALNFLMRDIESQEAEDPFQQQIGAKREAEIAGFPSSQAAGEYGRDFAEAKLNAPLEQARISGQYGVQKQGVASQAALDRERMIQRTKGNIAEGQQSTFKELGSMLQPGSSLNMTGVGGMRSAAPQRQQATVNPALLREITALRMQPKNPQTAAAMSQAINNALLTSNYDQDIRSTVANILNDEMYSRMKPEDVGADLMNDPDNSPEDIMQVVEALRLFMEQQPIQ